MNKVTKILIIITCVLLVIYFFVKGYEKQSTTISGLVGNKIGGGELSVSDHYFLSRCFEKYKDYLVNKDYENAYKMLNNNYKDYVDYEKFIGKVSNKKYSDYVLKKIKIITPSTFELLAGTSGDSEVYSIVIGNTEPKSFLLFPESFLDYKKIGKKVKKKGIEITVSDYVVNIDRTTINFEIKNNSNNTINNISGKLYTNQDNEIESKFDTNVIPKSDKELSIEFKTDYEFPKKIILNCNNDSKLNYVYEFKD